MENFEKGMKFGQGRLKFWFVCPISQLGLIHCQSSGYAQGVALTEPQVIKRLVKGLNSSTFKSVVISGDPQTLVEYYNIIRRLDVANLEADVEDLWAKESTEKEVVPRFALVDIESVVEKCLTKFGKSMISPEPWGVNSREAPSSALPDWRARGNIGTNFGAASALQGFGHSRPTAPKLVSEMANLVCFI